MVELFPTITCVAPYFSAKFARMLKTAPLTAPDGTASQVRSGATRYDDVDDAELVRAIADKDAIAMSEAYRRHLGGLAGFVTKLTGNPHLGEEVSQEVLMQLWEKPNRFDPERGSLKVYLQTRARSRALDVIRSEKARKNREERHGRLEPSFDPSPEDEVVRKFRAGQVRAALARLSPHGRNAIELAYLHGHSYRETAAMLQQPEGTVKSRIRAGLGRLQSELVQVAV